MDTLCYYTKTGQPLVKGELPLGSGIRELRRTLLCSIPPVYLSILLCFCNIAGHLENTGSLGLLRFFIMHPKREALPPILSKKSGSTDKLWSSFQRIHVFQNSSFCLKAQLLSCQHIMLFFLKPHFFILGKHLPSTCLNIHITDILK